MYQYQGNIIKVTDGETVIIDVDLGFTTRQKMVFRLYGINTPEVVGEHRALGLAAKKAVEELLPVGKLVTINTFKDKKEKFGRYLADIIFADNTGAAQSLSEYLLANGLAEKYLV